MKMEEMKELELKFINVEQMEEGIHKGNFEVSKKYTSGIMSIQFDFIIKKAEELNFHLRCNINDMRYQYMNISVLEFMKQDFILLECKEIKNECL